MDEAVLIEDLPGGCGVYRGQHPKVGHHEHAVLEHPRDPLGLERVREDQEGLNPLGRVRKQTTGPADDVDFHEIYVRVLQTLIQEIAHRSLYGDALQPSRYRFVVF